MKTAVIEDIKRDTTQLDAILAADESTGLMTNGQVIAVVVPIPEHWNPTPLQLPDFEAQRREVFGDRMLPAGTIQALIDEDR